MKIKFTALFLISLTMLTACVTGAGTSGGSTPLSQAPQTQTPTTAPTATSTSSPTETEAPSATPSLTPHPSQTATPQPFQTTSQWAQIKMFDLSSGWAIDSGGSIFHLTGDTEGWREVTPPAATRSSQAVAEFLDIQQAWVIYTGDPVPFTGPWEVWHTSDSGESWQSTSQIQPPTQEGLRLVQLTFLDAEHGWLLGQIYPGMNQVYAALYATSDGGNSWQLVSVPLPSAGSSEAKLPGSYSLPFGNNPLSFISPLTGFAGSDKLYATRDGGRTWNPVQVPQPGDLPNLEQPFGYFSPPRFSDDMHGIVEYMVFDFMHVYCPPCDIFDSPPAAIYTYYTQDGGTTWTRNPAPALMGTVGMIDNQTAWFLGRQDPAQTATTLFVSQDGGQTWTVRAQDTQFPFGTQLYFTSPDTGFAFNPYSGQSFEMFQVPEMTNLAGKEAYFYFTQDGGASWSPFPPAYP